MELRIEEARARANGESMLAGFSGAVRSISNVFQAGDVIIFNNEIVAWKQPIAGTKNFAQYCFVLVKRDDQYLIMKFYPTNFTKTRVQVNEDGSMWEDPATTTVQTTGSAVDLYRSKASIAEAMQQFAGQRIKVAADQAIFVFPFGTTENPYKTHIYKYELAGSATEDELSHFNDAEKADDSNVENAANTNGKA